VPGQYFILIGNYPPDRQESMIRFTDLLAVGLRSRGMTVEVVTPQPMLLGNKAHPGRGIAKWLGYVDKWILFPLTLRRLVRKRWRKFGDQIYYHICDHSNAPYLAHLPKERAAITCHDVLAIRGALGHPEAYCSASRTGIVLQRWILKHLSSAQRIACVSRRTLIQLCELSGSDHPGSGWKVVHNALNAEFKKIDKFKALQILEQNGIAIPQPFVLHVGSNLPRKNRRLLLQMSQQGDLSWSGNICFAGEPMDQLLFEEAKSLGITERVYSAAKPDHKTLCALYSLAHALVFPSFSEGFGWPIIEAQACGVPVIASNLDPLIEVGGGAARHADPQDAKSFAAALRTLDDPAIRQALIEKGHKNTARFGLMSMVDKYLELHDINQTAAVCTAN
jgi:glycosyltransferase involved in cell wall biosynthesis